MTTRKKPCDGVIQTSIEPVPCGLPFGHSGPHGLPKYVSPHGLTRAIYTVSEVDNLLDAECKAAVAAALEQAAIEMGRAHMFVKVGPPPRLEYLGFDDAAAAEAIRALSPDPNYIALREAEAEIAALDLAINCPELVRKQRDKMVEARDRIAKETK